jgi:protein-S-isoprenylcysteine O-methyltransferase Ste14
MSTPSSCAGGASERRGFRLTPPTLLLGLLVVCAAVALVLPTRGLDPWPYNFLGIVVILAGIVLNLWSDHQLKVAKTTVKPHERPSVLVTDGAFGLTRNPMYLGMALILAGTAITLGSLVALVCAALFVLAVGCWFIPLEERNAAAAFADAYAEYRRGVRRWV